MWPSMNMNNAKNDKRINALEKRLLIFTAELFITPFATYDKFYENLNKNIKNE